LTVSVVRQAGAVGTWGDMRKQEQLLSSLCLAAIAIVVAQPVRAEEKTLLQSPISTDLLTQQPLTTEAAEIIKVTGVRLKPTAQGLSIILETPTGRSLPAQTFSKGNALIADIPNTQLALPEESFRAENPTEGITSVTVTQVNANNIRVTVTGETAAPTAQIVQSASGLVLSVTPETPEAAEEVDIVVTASRVAQALEDVPRSVTVIEREQIQQQANVSPSRNLQDILTNLVPGLAPSTQSSINSNQTLRGRTPQVLIDGVPVRSNFIAQPRDLRSIDPASVDRVEVVRGPSAIYGDGGTGGVINIITRRPPDEEGIVSRAEVGVDFSTTNSADSFGNYLEYSLSGRQGNTDFLAVLSRKQTGGFFDAQGDRIPQFAPTADTETLNLLAKVGVDLTDEQRLQLTFEHFDANEDFGFISDPIVADLPGIQKARALQLDNPELIGSKRPGNRNTIVNLNYSHENLFGSRVQAQAYFRNSPIVTTPDDLRPFGFVDPGVYQTNVDKEAFGGRLQAETPLSPALSLLWGADYFDEDISQTIEVFDPEVFDASGRRIFQKTRDVTYTPPYNFNSLGLFAQLQWEVSDRTSVNGGARYERFGLDVDDYTAIGFGQIPDRAIEGGNINFDDVLFNLGAIHNITDEISLFASFAQGFSAPDFGNILRTPPDALTSVENDLEVTSPQKVDSFELGVRGNWSNIQASLAGFYSTSELGIDFVDSPVGFEIVRQPQRFYGLEATLDWQVGGGWGLGGTASLIKGEFEDEDGEYLNASSNVAFPPKLTAYVQYKTDGGWLNRLQLLFVGDRDAGFEDGSDPLPIESYTTLDYISSIPLLGGRLALSVENLLNEQYIPVVNQYFGGFGGIDEISNIAARGRTVRLGYSIEW
jgi:iron complex outermembrane recepter protein